MCPTIIPELGISVALDAVCFIRSTLWHFNCLGGIPCPMFILFPFLTGTFKNGFVLVNRYRFPPNSYTDKMATTNTTTLPSGPRPMFRSWGQQQQTPASRREYGQRRGQEERMWRQQDDDRRRSADAEKKAKDDAAKKASDISNVVSYPALGGGMVNRAAVAPGMNSFAELASQWKSDENSVRERRAQESREKDMFRRKREYDNMLEDQSSFLWNRQRREQDGSDYVEEEYQQQPRSNVDAEGWGEVSNFKTRKPRRELTVEELDEKYAEYEEDVNNDDAHNEHLFDVSHRHDHR